jgi:hypothetical protein
MTTRGCGMLVGCFSDWRENDGGRLVRPAGVAVEDGPCGRVTPKVGTDRLQPALHKLDPTRRHAPVAVVAQSSDAENLLNNGIANYAYFAAGVRS